MQPCHAAPVVVGLVDVIRECCQAFRQLTLKDVIHCALIRKIRIAFVQLIAAHLASVGAYALK